MFVFKKLTKQKMTSMDCSSERCHFQTEIIDLYGNQLAVLFNVFSWLRSVLKNN